jgi:hypothetical protein
MSQFPAARRYVRSSIFELFPSVCIFKQSGTLNMTFFRDYAKSINESIAKTTFGRFFRLQGCGRVSCAHIAEGRDFAKT